MAEGERRLHPAVARSLNLSLRARTLLALALLCALGLASADGATAVILRTVLLQRIDQQIDRASHPVLAVATGREPPWAAPMTGSARRPDISAAFTTLPPGTYGAVFAADGTVRVQRAHAAQGEKEPRPVLPTILPTPGPRQPAHLMAAAAGNTGSGFRVHVYALPGGERLVIAQSLSEMDDTVRRLLMTEALVSALVLAAVVGLGLWLVRIGLRPLDRITATADAIAAGDLTLRVPPGAPRTEVGRLAAAFNAMLARIEQAFTEQRAGEERLRQFVADASHELRTPLTSLRGYAELFRRGAAERPEDLARAMRRIEEEAFRMGLLVDELLLLARLDQGRPLDRTPLEVGEVVAEAVESAQAVEPDRPLALERDDKVIVVADRLRLRQLVDNLLANVRVHTPAGAPVEVRVLARGGQAVLEVADSGPGLHPATAARVFERFYRGDAGRSRDRGGSGLGLAIVEAIARAHGGAAEVRSQPGAGATFRVTLPLAP